MKAVDRREGKGKKAESRGLQDARQDREGRDGNDLLQNLSRHLPRHARKCFLFKGGHSNAKLLNHCLVLG